MPHRHYHTLKIQKVFRLKGLWGIYLNTAFRDLGLQLFAVFMPVYVYQLTKSIIYVFVFYAILHLFVLPGGFIAGKLVRKIGIDFVEFFSAVMRTFSLILLMLAKLDVNFLWIAAAVYGLAICFCWVPYHYTVAVRGDHDHFGQTVSKIEIISKIMLGLGPFLGGLIIVSFGFEALYFVSIIALLISGAVIFLDDFDRKRVRFDFKKMMRRFARPSLRKFWLSMVGNGIESQVYGVAWYLYIFLVVSSYTVLGGIQSVSILVSILMLWLVGNWVDKKGPQILNYGVAGNVLNWIIRPFLITGVFIFLSDVIYRFLSIFIWTPFMAVTYKKAKEMHSLEVVVQREWVIHASGFVTSLVMVGFCLLGLGWVAIFSLGIVGLLMCTLILTPGVEKKH